MNPDTSLLEDLTGKNNGSIGKDGQILILFSSGVYVFVPLTAGRTSFMKFETGFDHSKPGYTEDKGRVLNS